MFIWRNDKIFLSFAIFRLQILSLNHGPSPILLWSAHGLVSLLYAFKGKIGWFQVDIDRPEGAYSSMDVDRYGD